MKPKSEKSVLILIIILGIVFIPLGIWALIARISLGGTPKDSNTNHDFYYEGNLYFYNYDTLLGKYTCGNPYCNYVKETMDDNEYKLNYYNDSTIDKVTLINNKYAFLVDNASDTNTPVFLYDIINNHKMVNIRAVKNYTVGLENNYYIVQNTDGLWGVMQIKDNPSLVIPYTYNYIGVHNTKANNDTTLETDIFATKDTSGWKLISNANVALTNYFDNPIYDYNAKYVIISKDNLYYIYNFQNNLVVSFGYNAVTFISNYIGVINSSNQFYLLNPETTLEVSKRYTVTSMDDVKYEITSSGISLSIN